jgi:hypothetical protein
VNVSAETSKRPLGGWRYIRGFQERFLAAFLEGFLQRFLTDSLADFLAALPADSLTGFSINIRP